VTEVISGITEFSETDGESEHDERKATAQMAEAVRNLLMAIPPEKASYILILPKT